jgi:outer membrane receptor protein involved in Fe transport
VVIQPRFVPNLQVSFDHFDMTLDGAVSTIPLNTLLADLCYDSATPVASNPYCALVVRDASGATAGVPGGVSEVILTNQNVSSIRVKGYDAAIGYRFDVADLFGADQDFGKLSLRLDVTRMYAWKLQGLPGQKFTDLTNNLGNASPEWKANFSANYAWRDLTLGWATRFYGSAIPVTGSSAAALDPYYTGDYFMHDLKASYRLNDQIKLRGGVVNVTDENPPYLPETFNGTGTGASIYDNRGRFFYVGATLSY